MIIIMGSVGSGKTEQGTRLVRKLGCPRISTSQLLREHPTQKWQDHILSGKLVDDRAVIQALEQAFIEVAAETQEFILDGAPRTRVQAEWLTGKIQTGEVKLTAIINLSVSDEAVLKRLMSRGREDDQKQVILKRLDDYHKITQPILAFLEQSFKVHYVNGEDEPGKVERAIDNILGL